MSLPAQQQNTRPPSRYSLNPLSTSLYRSLPPSASRHVVALRDSFEVFGPSGRHTCLVMDPAGPCAVWVLRRDRRQRLPAPLARRVLRDVLLGLQALHPGNILVAIEPLGDDASSSALESKLRQLPSDGDPLIRRDGKKDLWAGGPPPARAAGEELVWELEPVVRLADLGAVFEEGKPPAKVVTAVALRAPEAVLRDEGGLPLGRGVDVWAFGCLVFEVLAGQPLFPWLEGLKGLAGEETADEATLRWAFGSNVGGAGAVAGGV
ncbi:kinase-like domain-containing protein [Staphylotrichum tortipilum]|uniref:Kinase-like domain-containing protein n=1 Tax=Staphylotrichum tortipilum TaxID=2831512 RepID=A0AAN6MDA2_9PEZI|nr:kinase-like domain-containing protein [Staphylotrichum longicolle]